MNTVILDSKLYLQCTPHNEYFQSVIEQYLVGNLAIMLVISISGIYLVSFHPITLKLTKLECVYQYSGFFHYYSLGGGTARLGVYMLGFAMHL